MSTRNAVRLVLVLLLSTGIAAAQKTRTNIYQAKQTPPVKMGTSGGNINDINSSYCCSGTLGSLVTNGNTLYVLSNSHVLALSGSVSPGPSQVIAQPGFVDNNCSTDGLNYVATLSKGPNPGDQNVDAAIAAVTAGKVDTSGYILGIGIPSETAATPTIGGGVAKSGRTTGLTCSTIQSVTTDVRVQYQSGCGIGTTWIVTYSNQIVIGGRFSAGGDSGSLIVTSDKARPVGLLFAGSSNSTIANPIAEVMSALNVSFVGGGDQAVGACQSSGGKPPKSHGTPKGLDRALVAKAKHAKQLMADPAVQGVGVGEADDDSGEAVVVVYVEAGRVHGPIPDQVDGVRTEIVRTDLFRAWGWNEPAGNSCRASR